MRFLRAILNLAPVERPVLYTKYLSEVILRKHKNRSENILPRLRNFDRNYDKARRSARIMLRNRKAGREPKVGFS